MLNFIALDTAVLQNWNILPAPKKTSEIKTKAVLSISSKTSIYVIWDLYDPRRIWRTREQRTVKIHRTRKNHRLFTTGVTCGCSIIHANRDCFVLQVNSLKNGYHRVYSKKKLCPLLPS
jgi:hypothetical protein